MAMFSFIAAFFMSLPMFDSTLYQMSEEAFWRLPSVQQPIDVYHPNYELLDAALFHQTNHHRRQYGLAPLQYRLGVHQAARFHSEAMIYQHFYSHGSPIPGMESFDKRIKHFDGQFRTIAENIAEMGILQTGKDNSYCFDTHADGSYFYIDCKTQRPMPMLSYQTLAQKALDLWMHSKGHRQNILSTAMLYMGCAGQISLYPYTTPQGPYIRLTQDFAGQAF